MCVCGGGAVCGGGGKGGSVCGGGEGDSGCGKWTGVCVGGGQCVYVWEQWVWGAGQWGGTVGAWDGPVGAVGGQWERGGAVGGSGCGGRASEGWTVGAGGGPVGGSRGGAGQRVPAGGPVGGGSGCGGRASGWRQWVRGAGQWVTHRVSQAVGAGGGPVGADGKGWGGELWRGNAGVRCSKAARGCALNASQGDCPGRTVSLGSPPPPSPAPTPPSLLPPDRLPAKVVCPAHFSPLPLRENGCKVTRMRSSIGFLTGIAASPIKNSAMKEAIAAIAGWNRERLTVAG